MTNTNFIKQTLPVFDPYSFAMGKINFPDFYKSTIGMEETFRKFSEVLSDITNSTSKYVNYPPYNIKKIDENKYVIEMAVAGFEQSNLEIELDNNTLIVKGNISAEYKNDSSEDDYLYKGIADRMFTRKFKLADMVEVKNTELYNGMLKIWLERFIPEEKKPRKIKINTNNSSAKEKFLLQEQN